MSYLGGAFNDFVHFAVVPWSKLTSIFQGWNQPRPRIFLPRSKTTGRRDVAKWKVYWQKICEMIKVKSIHSSIIHISHVLIIYIYINIYIYIIVYCIVYYLYYCVNIHHTTGWTNLRGRLRRQPGPRELSLASPREEEEHLAPMAHTWGRRFRQQKHHEKKRYGKKIGINWINIWITWNSSPVFGEKIHPNPHIFLGIWSVKPYRNEVISQPTQPSRVPSQDGQWKCWSWEQLLGAAKVRRGGGAVESCFRVGSSHNSI